MMWSVLWDGVGWMGLVMCVSGGLVVGFSGGMLVRVGVMG